MTLYGSCAFSSSVLKFVLFRSYQQEMGRFLVNGRPICNNLMPFSNRADFVSSSLGS